MISLFVLPKTAPMTWDSFCFETPKYSIGLDGFVKGGPMFNALGPHVNFNHHEEVNRLATRATCGQVLLAIRQGLLRTFRDNNGPKMNIFVNDCDEDVCTSVWLLRNHVLAGSVLNPRLNRLVDMEEKLDATAGAYPYPEDLPTLRQLAWVFEPYRSFRLNGGLDRKISSEFEQVIRDVELRISAHVMGSEESIHMDTSYEVLHRSQSWVMVKESGAYAKTGMFSDGIRAYMTVRSRPNGRYTYTIGRMSPFVDFPVPELIQALNLRELAQNPGSNDLWGGGDTIGGSPRVNGTGMNPETVQRIVEEALQARNTK